MSTLTEHMPTRRAHAVVPLKEMDAAELVITLTDTAAVLDPTGVLPDLLARAAAEATTAHRGQTRANRAGLPRTPYIEHPLRNTIRLMRWGVTDLDTLCASLLHDVPEDCADRIAERFRPAGPTHESSIEVAHAWVRELFGAGVERVVRAVTNPAPISADRDERQRQYRAHVAQAVSGDASVLLVKVADFVDNAGSLHHNVGHTPDRFITTRARKYRPLTRVLLQEVSAAGARGDIRFATAFLAGAALRRVEERLAGLDTVPEPQTVVTTGLRP